MAMFLAGIVACGIGFLFPVLFAGSPYYKFATPFFFIALILSLPTAALVSLLPTDDPSFIIIAMPASLAINALLVGSIITAFLKLKRFTDRKIYGND